MSHTSPESCTLFMRGCCFYETKDPADALPYAATILRGCHQCRMSQTKEDIMGGILNKLDQIEKYLKLHGQLAKLIEKEEKRVARHNALVRSIIDTVEAKGISPRGLIPEDVGVHHLKGCPHGTNSAKKYDIGEMFGGEICEYIHKIVMRHLVKCPLCHALDANQKGE